MNSVQSTLGAVATPLVGGLSYLLGRGGIDGKGIQRRVAAVKETNMIPSSVPSSQDLETMVTKARNGASKLKSMSASERAKRHLMRTELRRRNRRFSNRSIKYKGSYEKWRRDYCMVLYHSNLP